jgi:hypothetical protein
VLSIKSRSPYNSDEDSHERLPKQHFPNSRLDDTLKVLVHQQRLEDALDRDSSANDFYKAAKRKKRSRRHRTKSVVMRHVVKVDAFNLHHMENILNKVCVGKADKGVQADSSSFFADRALWKPRKRSIAELPVASDVIK